MRTLGLLFQDLQEGGQGVAIRHAREPREHPGLLPPVYPLLWPADSPN